MSRPPPTSAHKSHRSPRAARPRQVARQEGEYLAALLCKSRLAPLEGANSDDEGELVPLPPRAKPFRWVRPARLVLEAPCRLSGARCRWGKGQQCACAFVRPVQPGTRRGPVRAAVFRHARPCSPCSQPSRVPWLRVHPCSYLHLGALAYLGEQKGVMDLPVCVYVGWGGWGLGARREGGERQQAQRRRLQQGRGTAVHWQRRRRGMGRCQARQRAVSQALPPTSSPAA